MPDPFRLPRLPVVTPLLGAICILASLMPAAIADITFFGSVKPTPPSGSAVVNGVLIVGDEDAADPDVLGFVRIDEGTDLEFDSLIVGDEEGWFGEVVVSGTSTPGVQTSFTLSDNGTTTNPTVQIGHEGVGTLTIEDGAVFAVSHMNGDMAIGVEATGSGHVTVRDPWSVLSVAETLFVGDEGIGRLEILNGAIARTVDSNDAVTIGAKATAVGTVVVQGFGSRWHIANDLTVGGSGIGNLTIGEGAFVDADNSTSPETVIGSRGRVELTGGSLLADDITVDGYLGGSGLVRGDVALSAGAVIAADSGDRLRFSHDVVNQGSITIASGEVEFLAAMMNNSQGTAASPGRISLEDAQVRFSQPLTNSGVIASASGTNNFHGEITNGADGTIVVAGSSVATFHDAVDLSSGSLELLPGANVLFLSDLVFQAGGLLALELNANGLSAEQPQIAVAGETTLAGELAVRVAGDFRAEIGDVVRLLSASGGISGTFDTQTLPPPAAGLVFDVLYEANTVSLLVQPDPSAILAGDYNRDGIVNTADYTVWRDALGQIGADLPADGNGDGTVNGEDYDLWHNNFGSTFASSQSNRQSVPEPTTMAVVMGIAIMGALGRIRRCSRWLLGDSD